MYPQHKCNFQFSASQSGGKLENRLYRLWERRKSCNCQFSSSLSGENWNVRFTADESGGKAAISSFPPLIVEENRKMRVYRPCRRR
ncbi:hypothetical protein AAC387_Pa04g0737 [Persea americana]